MPILLTLLVLVTSEDIQGWGGGVREGQWVKNLSRMLPPPCFIVLQVLFFYYYYFLFIWVLCENIMPHVSNK